MQSVAKIIRSKNLIQKKNWPLINTSCIRYWGMDSTFV